MLWSPAFARGEMIPLDHACAGDNVSPELNWSGGPAAGSYAIVFTDNSNGLIHWALWDIPAELMTLAEEIDSGYEPADVPGAKQSENYFDQRFYAGPCPPEQHNYEFMLYAVDQPSLENLDMSSTREEIELEIQAHAVAMASLAGVYDPP